jgi:hypothetical protein
MAFRKRSTNEVNLASDSWKLMTNLKQYSLKTNLFTVLGQW